MFYRVCLEILNIIVPLLWSDCSLPGGLLMAFPNTSNEAHGTSSGGHPYWEERQQKSKVTFLLHTSFIPQELASFLRLAVFPTVHPFEQILAQQPERSSMQGVHGNDMTKKKGWGFLRPITTTVIDHRWVLAV